MKYFKYLKYLLTHKWFVMIECFKAGLWYQGLVHDNSKFLPSEFIPYMNHFFSGDNPPIRDKTGYYKPTDTGDKEFDFAWFLHQKRNKHHWQWWVLPDAKGTVKVMEMFDRYLEEMICDWRGAGKAQKNLTGVREWYLANKDKMQFNPETTKLLEEKIKK